MHDLFGAVKRAAQYTDATFVKLSIGKDSIVTLDLCVRYFKHVQPVFMYVVEGLEFQEVYLRHIERRYSVKVVRVPHHELARIYKSGMFREVTTRSYALPTLRASDVDNDIRRRFGIEYIASGEKAIDSLNRRGMINQCDGVDTKHHRIYPVGWWNNAAIYAYIKAHQLPLPDSYKYFKRSLYPLDPLALPVIAEHYPADFLKIKEVFPHVEAAIFRSKLIQDRRRRDRDALGETQQVRQVHRRQSEPVSV